MITAIWPSYQNVSNHLPAMIGITTKGMVSYLIYWLIQLPLLLIPTHRLQYLFTVKGVLVVPMVLAMTIWISVKAGAASSDFFREPATVSGSTRAWLWLSSLVSHPAMFSCFSSPSS